MKRIIVFLLLITIIATGCSKEISDLTCAYTMVIDKLYNEDMALNHDIKYIAIDTSLINNLSIFLGFSFKNRLTYFKHLT